MNLIVYRHFLTSYGRRPGVWFGFSAELIRTVLRMLIAVVMAQIVSSVASGNTPTVQLYTFYFLIIYLLEIVIGAAGDLIAIRSENNEYDKLAHIYYRKLANKDMAFYKDHQTGYLASTYRLYLDSLVSLQRMYRSEIIPVVVTLIMPLIVLSLASWSVGLIALGVVFIQAVYIMWTSTKANAYRARVHEVYRRLSGEVSDNITNIVAYKSSGTEEAAEARVRALKEEETALFWVRRKMNILLDAPRGVVTACGVALACWLIVGSSSGAHHESVGLITLTFLYMFQIVSNINRLPELIVRHDDLVTKIYPTLEYLENEYETITDKPGARQLKITEGRISIKKVDFSYDNDKDAGIKVFRDLSIDIKGGEHVGIVGLSGAGKSTLASLLMRFDEIDAGSISIDGIDIRDVAQSELRKQIAFVPQEPLLFHRSIRENITYFNTTATDEEVIRAAKAAHAHDFVSALAKGYDTIVGERGIKLSGGQKQRVVIARAILKNAPIMIFDEATSALDSESERIIQSAMPQIIGKHTAIVIAHRLSTVAGLDRIIVMHDGKIVEDGTHDELLEKRGRYYSLWQKQQSGKS